MTFSVLLHYITRTFACQERARGGKGKAKSVSIAFGVDTLLIGEGYREIGSTPIMLWCMRHA